MEYNDLTKPASEVTRQVHQQMKSLLDFEDAHEKNCALHNCLKKVEDLEIKNAEGEVIWSQKIACLDEEQEVATINPSLYRNAWLNHQTGLFKVVDGIYQVRGYDMSNLTVIAGKTGWIVCDPLISCECSKAALALVNEVLGERPVSAIVISHPHLDHFGGIKGIVDEAAVCNGQVPLIVPEHYTFHAVSENVYAMNAMQRRACYQYGTALDFNETGAIAMGIGMGQSRGTVTFIRPTDEIKHTGEKRIIDGIEFIFQMTPETESPAEMCWYLPQFKALWMAELCNATMHNLYTLRGTQIRDGNAWAFAITQAKALFGSEAEVLFQAHNWPHWGNREVNEILEETAAVYKFINDQTLLYMNQGLTPNEIAHTIQLPKSLEKVWTTRQYYGTLSHNAKAVYQRYLGWYDGNPVNLNPLTPTEQGQKLIALAGSSEALLKQAEKALEKGEYQWAAQLSNAVVFAEPDNLKARYLCADAMEQMGYQAESGPWRNCYLNGADELRHGVRSGRQAKNSGDLARCMDSRMMLDYWGILIDGQRAENLDIKLNLMITDTQQRYCVHLIHGALLVYPDIHESDADATLTMPRLGLAALLTRPATLQDKGIQIDGDAECLTRIMEVMVDFDRRFAIIEP
ncbi:alkyl/aryl-sulfatase [Holdemania massiliensis]|uniref:alkyl/aryl-sulfatase n=1 Tax=Holdemania massiliensis TaxID=1468449 RepID=UPI001F053D9B|nr:alkyl sulfatase dimerization domain-containing protein [Holdemania massiliensis]MCH1940663.1 MBL fold metallo-hydrolase [Holdemania massiliensis]